MHKSIQMIVAECVRDVLIALDPQTAPSKDQISDSPKFPRQAITDNQFVRSPKLFLDVTGAEQLDGGSLLLWSSKEPFTCWTIFVRAATQSYDNAEQFFLRGVIGVSLDPSGFVSESYRCVLNRPVDEDGEAIYTNLIANGRLTHCDVLRILASSEEAQDRRERLLIVAGRAGLKTNNDTYSVEDRVSHCVFISK